VSGLIQLAILIVVAIVLSWMTNRARRLLGGLARRTLTALAALATVLCWLVAVVGVIGAYRLYAPHSASPTSTTVQVAPDQLLVGQRRATGCAGCHSASANLPLDGGNTNLLGGALGTLYAPNLTPGGPLKDWTDAEIARAIREGVDRDGRALLIMPSDAFHHLSDADVNVLVAYLRSQPSVAGTTPGRDASLLGLGLIGAGALPTAEQPHIAQPQSAPPAGVTPEYGQYLADITGCRMCHGADLQGRAPGGFGQPAGPSLGAIAKAWPEGDFVRFFRTGDDPSGRQVDPARMPWRDIGRAYTDDELRAMFAYLRTLS
jgi:cytochrome c553